MMTWEELSEGTYSAHAGGFRLLFDPSRNALQITATDYHADPEWVTMEELPGGGRARIVRPTRKRPVWAGVWVILGALVGAVLALGVKRKA